MDVIVMTIDSTEEALNEALAGSNHENWAIVIRDVDSSKASEVVDALAEYNLDVEALLR